MEDFKYHKYHVVVGTLPLVRDTSSVRIYKEDLKKIWDLVTFERKSIADVVHYLLNFYRQTKVFNEESQCEFEEVKDRL